MYLYYLVNLTLRIDAMMDFTEPVDDLDSDSFTCIIDKATLDCVACSDEYSHKAK